MKQVLGVMVLSAGLAWVSGQASAEEFQAIGVCKARGAGQTAQLDATGISADSTTASTRILCPLKRVQCTAGQSPCTWTADVYGYDGHSTNAADSNTVCRLRYQTKNQAGANVTGSDQTIAYTGALASISLSAVANTGGSSWDGWIYVECDIGKIDGTGNRSYITWIGNTNF
jgi:hypothetical protein